MNFVAYKFSYGGALIGGAEKRAIMKIVDKNWWPWAKEGELFEKEAADFLGVKYGLAANSGSSAGLLALLALELPRGSEVIIPAVTFPTIFNIIPFCGLTPVVVDCEIGTYNIDVEKLEQAISRKTKAIICVHAVGNPCDMVAINKIAKKHKLYVIEDNCLSGDTKIKTSKGDVLLRDIKVGDEVMTRKGYRRVLRHIDRGEREVMTRLGVTGTPDHPFITTNGVKSLDGLQPSDILYTWNEKLSCIEERTITDIQSLRSDTREFTTGLVQKLASWLSIDKFGLTTMGLFLEDVSFTIKTIIRLITTSLTSNSWQNPSIVACTVHAQKLLDLRYAILQRHVREQRHGMPLMKHYAGKVSGTRKGDSLRKERVYDLEVEEAHEFFANGILVHNCDGWGGSIQGKKVGTFSDISFTSFHAAHIVAMGQGGGVFTNNKTLYKNARMYRDWGRQSEIKGRTNNNKWPNLPKDQDARFIYEKMGLNISPLELQAAMGRVQLKRTKKIKALRKRNYDYLRTYLSEFEDLVMPDTVQGAEPSWFAFPLSTLTERAPLIEHLEKNGIETRSMFSGNILRHPAYENVPHRVGNELNGANWILEHSFWIGVHPRYEEKDLDYVINIFGDYYKKHKANVWRGI